MSDNPQGTTALFKALLLMSVLFIVFIYLLTCLYSVVTGAVKLTGNPTYDTLLVLVPMFFGMAVMAVMYSRYVANQEVN